MGISYGFGYVSERRERVGEEVSEWVAEGGEGAFLGGLVSMRGREGRGRSLGDGRNGPFLSVPRGPSGAWLGTLLRSLSILLFLFWVFFGGLVVGGDLFGDFVVVVVV